MRTAIRGGGSGGGGGGRGGGGFGGVIPSGKTVLLQHWIWRLVFV